MSNYRRPRRRVDENQQAIVDALRAYGWKVISLAILGGGAPDLLAHHSVHGFRLIEVKGRKKFMTPAQVKFLNEGWPVYLVSGVEDVQELSRRHDPATESATAH